MRTAWADYYVFPRVVPANQLSTIHIIPRGQHAALPTDESFRVMILPMEKTMEPYLENDEYPSFMIPGTGAGFSFSWKFEGEQEHLIRIDLIRDGKAIKQVRAQLSVYSAEPDLLKLRPFRGDFHVHTNRSDGRESPEYVVARYRKAGFDFMAITDHRRYQPSEEAIRAYDAIPTGIKLYHGEEVHAPGNHTHIVNFGGDYSVNELFQNDPDRYREEVEALVSGMGDLPEGVDRFEYAASVWVFDQIRRGNGLAIFAHPHWIANVYHVRDAMSWHLFREMPFDAFELLGGQSKRENNMQCSLYEEARAMGMKIPIVGSSDSHGTVNRDNFEEESTYVFAESCTRESLLEAVKDFRSVAVEAYKHDELPFIHGPYRMAKYAMFLIEAYFPQHDELCAIEGGLMHLAIEGDEMAKEMLSRFVPRVDEFREKCFG